MTAKNSCPVFQFVPLICVFLCVSNLWVQVCTESGQVVQNYHTFICIQLAECQTRSDTPTQQWKTAEGERRIGYTQTVQYRSRM